MNFTLDPNMGFPNPNPGVDPGPDYAQNLFASLSILGSHDHTPGQGVLVPVAGINVNANFPLQGNNLTTVRTVNFNSQSGTLTATAPDLGCIYVAGNELVYNDKNGNIVPITNNGSVNSGAGSISGLPSGTASAAYNAGSSTFIWRSATLTPADMDGGSFIFRQILASAKGIKVSSPNSLAADYQMFWPSALPVSSKLMTLDNAGDIAAAVDVDNASLEIAANVLEVKDDGITFPKLAPEVRNAILGATQVITTNGSYVVPADVTGLYVSACGGGGGGGAGGGGGIGGGGGGGGGSAVFERRLTVVGGETLTIVIGSGGSGGGTGGAAGASGSDTTITGSSSGLIMTCAGGTRGLGGANGGAGSAGGAGGAGSGNAGSGTAGVAAGPAAPGGAAWGFGSWGQASNGGNGGTSTGGGGGNGGGGGGAFGVGGQSNPGTNGSAGGIGAGGGGGQGGASGASGGVGGAGQVTISIA